MPGKNKVLNRYLEPVLKKLIKKNQSFFIFGPRQTGKTFLVKKILKKLKNTIEYSLQNPAVRLNLESDPGRLIREIEAIEKPPYVFIDEGQKIPLLFDAVQYLIDEKKATFFITGSSARKLRRKGTNLLPGRVKRFFLDPLLWGELGWLKKSSIKPLALKNINYGLNYSFEDQLIFGSLPLVVLTKKEERESILTSYTQIYLEEEIRAEALSRKIGSFLRFLELAALESGTSPNLTKLSLESGVSLPAIKEFYQLLVDTLIVHRVDPYLKNARKRLLTSPRYYFFDLGVRNALSYLPLNQGLVKAQKGTLFEHAVILEVIRRIRALNKNYRLYYWRTANGAEVDCVVDTGEALIPIEIKSSSYVTLSEIKGLKIFLEDYKDRTSLGYVITLGKKPEKLAKNILALPWDYL